MTKKSFFTIFSGCLLCFGCSCSKSTQPLKNIEQPASNVNLIMTTATTTTTTTTTITTMHTPQLCSRKDMPNTINLHVEPILQYPELPTGCEITSLTMLLQYNGFSVDKETMATDYLPCSYETDQYTLDDVYIGSPYDDNGYGCYAPVLEKTANAYFVDQNSDKEAKDLTGSSKEIILQYIASGYPVVMWETIGLYDVNEEIGWKTEDGREVMWCTLEHCVLLHGYDLEENTVFVCDPTKGDVTYDLDRYFEIYEDMHQRALIVY